jgi:predicted negative regulator of RcsB-dependent stress response
MAEKIRYTRKDLKGPDEFISTFSRTVEWIRENSWKVAAAVSAVVLLFGGVFGTKAYYRWQEEKATRDLWPHLNRARDLLQAPSVADDEKLGRLEQFLTYHVNTHPGSSASVYARYYLGSIAFLRGNFDLSAAQFRAAIATGKDTELMRFLIRQGLAETLEAKGDFAAAFEAYREAAGAAGADLRTEALLGQARTASLSGRKQEAASLYRRILTENPGARGNELIEIKLAQLE